MQELKIDIELENLLPKLEEEKYKLLEEDIVKNGCINPIIIWNDYIVDGHHRYKVCKANNIEFKTKEMQFENKQEAMIWAWTTQKARRNIDDGTLFKIAKVFKPYYEKKAKERQIEAGKNFGKGFQKSEKAIENEKKERQIEVSENTNNMLYMKSDKALKQDTSNIMAEKVKPINTTKELAKTAGVSTDTMNKVIQVQKHAPEPIQKAVENNVISINKGYELTKQIKDLPKEIKEEQAEKLLDDQFKKESKELDRAHRIYCKINDAVYKPISVEITEENVGYWLEDMSQEEIIEEEKNIDDAIDNLKEIKRIMQNYKMIRRVK